jgi:hypothetical protein
MDNPAVELHFVMLPALLFDLYFQFNQYFDLLHPNPSRWIPSPEGKPIN